MGVASRPASKIKRETSHDAVNTLHREIYVWEIGSAIRSLVSKPNDRDNEVASIPLPLNGEKLSLRK